jgi:hypothetical protein
MASPGGARSAGPPGISTGRPLSSVCRTCAVAMHDQAAAHNELTVAGVDVLAAWRITTPASGDMPDVGVGICDLRRTQCTSHPVVPPRATCKLELMEAPAAL